jgi:Fe/S biogenesis protein NfuA
MGQNDDIKSPFADAADAAPNDTIVEITDSALEMIRDLRASESDAESLGLRLAIASAPGEDFRYDLSFEEFLTAAFTDEVRTIGDIKVIVPADSVEFLQGAVLDHNEAQGLVIRNPNRPAAPMIEGLTSDDELSAEVEAVLASDVNPALAGHGGFVTYVGHDGEGMALTSTSPLPYHGCSPARVRSPRRQPCTSTAPMSMANGSSFRQPTVLRSPENTPKATQRFEARRQRYSPTCGAGAAPSAKSTSQVTLKWQPNGSPSGATNPCRPPQPHHNLNDA